MNETLENKTTESKISVETRNMGDDILYIIRSKKGQFEVTCKGDATMLITAPVKTMTSAVGGRGEDNGKDAWFSDEHCKSNSEVAHSILELLKVISE
jgi:hypothetical protein